MGCGAAVASNWDVGIHGLIRCVGALGTAIGPSVDFYRFAVNPRLAMGALGAKGRDGAVDSIEVKMLTSADHLKTLTFRATD